MEIELFCTKISEDFANEEVITTENPNYTKSMYGDLFSYSPEKPFGRLGDITPNLLYKSFKDLKWKMITKNAEITIKAYPFAIDCISYFL